MKNQKGLAAVEFVIAVPILIMLLMAVAYLRTCLLPI
jgi:Flp pilus assembly protein TadG